MAGLVEAGAMLVLDAGRGPAACGAGTGDALVVCARGDLPTTVVPFTLGGVAGRMRIDPGGPDEANCNAGFIARTGIVGRGPFPLARIGPVVVRGWSASASMEMLGRSFRHDLRWTGASRVVEGADCVTGPRRLGDGAIRFLLGPVRAEAVATVLPFHRTRGHVYAAWPVGRETLAIRFEQSYRATLLAAPAAQAVAPVLGGSATGEEREEKVAYGIARPVRPFRLHRPLVIGALRLADPYVRVDDYGQARGLRSLAPDEGAADDAIVVAGKRRKPGKEKLVRVGADDMARCVSITVDMAAKTVTVLC